MRRLSLIALAITAPLVSFAAPPSLVIAPTAATADATSASTALPPINSAAPLQQPVATMQSDRLKSMYARIPELRAQADIAELEARIRTANAVNPVATPASLAAPLPSATPTGKVGRAPARNAFSSSSFDLLSIRAYNNTYSAILQNDGSVVPVVVGDVIGDGWRVSEITERQVELTRKGHQPRILRIM